nr:cupin domain-containing protein [uncultured Roseococcus sp.]
MKTVAVAAFAAGLATAWVAGHAASAWHYVAHMPAASTEAVARPLVRDLAAPATVMSGDPRFEAVAYSTTANGSVQSGIFAAHGPSTFNWRFAVDEAIYIHEGEVTLDYMGSTFTARPGDTVFFRAGTNATWTVPQYVRKSWTIHQPNRATRLWRRVVN